MSNSVKKALHRVRSIQTDLKHLFKRARAESLSYEAIQRSVASNTYENPGYQELPRWAKGEVDGYLRALDDAHWDTLHWTLLLDGKRVCSKLPEDAAKMEHRYGDINKEISDPETGENLWGMFCYLLDVHGDHHDWLPYNEDDRKRESKRLSQLR